MRSGSSISRGSFPRGKRPCGTTRRKTIVDSGKRRRFSGSFIFNQDRQCRPGTQPKKETACPTSSAMRSASAPTCRSTPRSSPCSPATDRPPAAPATTSARSRAVSSCRTWASHQRAHRRLPGHHRPRQHRQHAVLVACGWTPSMIRGPAAAQGLPHRQGRDGGQRP